MRISFLLSYLFILHLICFSALGQSTDSINHKLKNESPTFQLGTGIDRFDIWISSAVTAKLGGFYIRPTFELAIIRTFFLQSISPKIGLSFGKNLLVKRKFQLGLDLGVDQVFFGVNQSKEAIFDTQVGLKLNTSFGEKNGFVFRFGPEIGARHFSFNDKKRYFYSNLNFQLFFKW